MNDKKSACFGKYRGMPICRMYCISYGDCVKKSKYKLEYQCVKEFKADMERRLDENKTRCGWSECDHEYLLDGIRKNVADIERFFIAYRMCKTDEMKEEFSKSVIDASADVSNYAMMIADNIRNGRYFKRVDKGD
jgi:hypothetical protein